MALDRGDIIACPECYHLVARVSVDIPAGEIIRSEFLEFQPNQQLENGKLCVCLLCGASWGRMKRFEKNRAEIFVLGVGWK